MWSPIESSGSYRGRYFVLMGHLSPLDGIGPEQLGIRELEAILAEGGVRELILATNSTVEGEATAHYLSELAARRGDPREPHRAWRAGGRGARVRRRRHAGARARRPAVALASGGSARRVYRERRGPRARGELLVQPPQPPVAFVAPRVQRAGLSAAARTAHCGLAHVAAVAEAAAARETRHFREAETCAHRAPPTAGAKSRTPGGVDECRAAGQVEQARRGGGVAPFLLAHQLADRDLRLRHQALHQRGLADA